MNYALNFRCGCALVVAVIVQPIGCSLRSFSLRWPHCACYATQLASSLARAGLDPEPVALPPRGSATHGSIINTCSLRGHNELVATPTAGLID